jgi:hypothetical protein
MPPGMPPASPFSSETPAIMASVVSMRPAIEAAFCRAVRVTFAGSMTPAETRAASIADLGLRIAVFEKKSVYKRNTHRGDA